MVRAVPPDAGSLPAFLGLHLVSVVIGRLSDFGWLLVLGAIVIIFFIVIVYILEVVVLRVARRDHQQVSKTDQRIPPREAVPTESAGPVRGGAAHRAVGCRRYQDTEET